MKTARQFTVETEAQCAWLCAFLGRQEMPFQVTAGPVRKQRTSNQNRRYWAIVQLAAETTGYSLDELHEEFLCQHFGYTEVERKSPWTGEIETKRIPMKRSSTREKKEFAEFTEYVERFCGDTLGVWLPVGEEA